MARLIYFHGDNDFICIWYLFSQVYTLTLVEACMKFVLQAILQSTAFIYPFLGSVETWNVCNFRQLIKKNEEDG